MACVPAAASSPKTEACPAFAARSRWPSNSAFTRASQCGNRRRMLRPRPRRRRRDARGAQSASEPMAQGFQAPSTNAATGMRSGRSPPSARRCVPRSGEPASIPHVNAREATARAIGGGDDGVPYGLESKAQRARDFRCWRGHAGHCPPRRGPRRGRGLQDHPHRPNWEAYEARADANVEKKVAAAQLDVFGK